MTSPQARPGPLVEPGLPLSDDQAARASRQMLLPGFGEEAQRRLQAARVLVIGAGGLGSASVPYLAGAGVGTIGIIDDDVVELSNLHRQIGHRTEDIGRRKAESLADTALALNPDTHIVQHDLRLNSSNALELFGDYDLVIDGSDNFPTRYLANDAASLAGIPLVWGAILSHHGQVGVAWHTHGPGYRDLFPAPPEPGDVVTCVSGGVLPGLCGTIGSLLVTEAMKLITGTGTPLIGRVLVYDALAARTREIAYDRDDTAQPVTALIDYELFCAGASAPPSVTPEELAVRIHHGEALLLDVRTAEEREASRIEPSIALTLAEIEAGGLHDALNRGARVTVYCAAGPRSIRATTILRERGLDAEYLAGGITQCARTTPQLVVHGTASGAASASASLCP